MRADQPTAARFARLATLDPKERGEILRTMRKRTGLTRQSLADAGLSSTTIARIEAGTGGSDRTVLFYLQALEDSMRQRPRMALHFDRIFEGLIALEEERARDLGDDPDALRASAREKRRRSLRLRRQSTALAEEAAVEEEEAARIEDEEG